MPSPDFDKARQEAAEMGFDTPDLFSQGAVVNRAVYESYIAQEFTPKQALYLTACGLTGNPGVPPDDN